MIFNDILFVDNNTFKGVLSDYQNKLNSADDSLDYISMSQKAHEMCNYVELNSGVKLQDSSNTKKLSKDERVAVIPIHGMMQREFSYWYQCCSTNFVRKQIAAANADPNILAIVLDVNSGGGTAAGTYELHEAIRTSEKPVITAYTDLGASAAVWAGSAASEVYATTPITQVGSVGAITTHTDISRFYAEMGVTMSVITSSGSEAKKVGTPYEPLSEEDKQIIQTRLNKFRDVFMTGVRKTRAKKEDVNFDEAAIKTANIFDAKVAQEIGLTDGTMSMEKVILRAFRLGRKYRKDKKNKSQTSKTNNNINSMVDLSQGRLDAFVAVQPKRYTEELTLQPEYLNALADKLEGLTSDNAELQASNEELKGQVDQFKSKASSFETQITELTETNEALTAKNTELNEKVESMTAELSEKEETVAGLNEKLESGDLVSKDSIEALQAELAELKESNETLTAQVETLEAEKVELNESVEGLTEKLESTEAELEKTEAAYNEMARKAGTRAGRAVKTTATRKETKLDNEKEVKTGSRVLGSLGGGNFDPLKAIV